MFPLNKSLDIRGFYGQLLQVYVDMMEISELEKAAQSLTFFLLCLF